MTTRVFISARVRLYRDGLARDLAREDGIDVIGTSGQPGETVDSVHALEPDVVLLDPALPGGMDTIRELANPAAGPKVVALASPETEAAVVACAEAGVCGYVTHDDALGDLLATIRSVVQGELLCSPRMAGALLRRLTAIATERAPGPDAARLTSRELEVARLIDEGLSNKQIARRLCIELPTVKNHVHHILDKLAVARRGEAVACLRHGGHLRRSDSSASPRE